MEWFVSTGVGVEPDTFQFVLLLAYCITHWHISIVIWLLAFLSLIVQVVAWGKKIPGNYSEYCRCATTAPKCWLFFKRLLWLRQILHQHDLCGRRWVQARSVIFLMYKKDLTILSCFPINFITLNTPESSFANLTTQNELTEAWLSLIPRFSTSQVHMLPSIQHAVEVTWSLQGQRMLLNVLVCGSLHLVGGVIEIEDLAEIALCS